jgi:hypothetical protein
LARVEQSPAARSFHLARRVGLFPAEQARIVALLVERVEVDSDGLNVRLRVDGLGSLAREMLAGGIEAAA